MYSVEWQNRGLPHAHILIWLKVEIVPTQIDDIICAELRDPEEDQILFDIVCKQMVQRTESRRLWSNMHKIIIEC